MREAVWLGADNLTRLARLADRHRRRLREAAARQRQPSEPQALSLRSPAGYELPCRLYPAPDRAAPGVLLVPGALDGMSSLEGLSCVLTAPRLARAGLTTLVFTPSGREGAAGREDYCGPLHQVECAAALRLLLARTERVAVVSISFGLPMAMGALIRHPRLAESVAVMMDWEGPGHRRWLRSPATDHTTDPAYWAPREAVTMVGALACPYHRVQSRWDHVHGRQRSIGTEMLEAASGGTAPAVWINDQRHRPGLPPRWISARPSVQGRLMVGWLRDWLGPQGSPPAAA